MLGLKKKIAELLKRLVPAKPEVPSSRELIDQVMAEIEAEEAKKNSKHPAG